MGKKRILFLINTLRDGGAEKILVDIVNHLDPEMFDVEVRLIYRRGVYLDSLREGVKLTSIAGELRTFRARQVSHLLPRLSSRMLHRLFVHGHYDTEIAFLEGYATKIVGGASRGTRTLAWVHCDLTKNHWTDGCFPSEQALSACYRRIGTIVCVSEGVRDALAERVGALPNLLVRYNPVDADSIRKLSGEGGAPEASCGLLTIVSMGRMVDAKDFPRLLHAVANLIDEGYNLQLWLLGDGEQRDELERYVIERGITNHVLMPGYVENPYPWLAAADLYACSSLYEGFSTAIAEALVIGCPVLSTDVVGTRELLGDSRYGLVVKNDDQAFEDGLRSLIDHPDLLADYRKRAAVRGRDFELLPLLHAIEELL